MNVAVVGAGHMGRYHAQKLAARSDCKLVAVVDADRVRAEALAAAHGCAAHTDYRAILGMAAAAVVCVPTERHREVAGACLEAGLHVLVEKPIAVDLREADELVRLAGQKKRVLHVGHVERCNGAFRALAARMQRPLFIDAERLSGFKQRGADVDVVLDLMIHDLDLALSLAKGEVSDVGACGFRVLTGDIDIANARIEFSDGCVASLSASRVSQAPVRKLRVFQTDLYVSADLQAGRLRYVRQTGGAIEEQEENYAGGDALAVQAEQFVSSILKSEPAGVDGAQGARALKLALEVGRLVRERLQRFG
ncbi:MAG TPA: Gfo/Idh/MocA family oxidoreductase [Burkholderiales bacterium]|nr:Gfo/Idh/MocA family oxidoreductase [Burkholderiales bacterium]